MTSHLSNNCDGYYDEAYALILVPEQYMRFGDFESHAVAIRSFELQEA